MIAPVQIQAADQDWAETEAQLLTNVKQLTHPDMGFDKAGEGYLSPDMTSIIFQAVPKGQEHYQIYTMSLADPHPQMVSTGKGECTCAYFHPTKPLITFASSHLDPALSSAPDADEKKQGFQVGTRKYVWNFNPHMDIFQADPDGANLKRLTTEKGYDAEGAFDRTGTKIAFASNRTGDMEIYTMNADGSDVFRLTHAPGYDGGPFISPDGKRVIFRADRKQNDLLQLFVIDIDGKNEQQLTDNDAVNWGPYWHPNGKTIAFATSLHGHHNYEVYLMHLPTQKLHRLTHAPGFDGLPVFSPDGKKLMWTSKRGPDQTSQLFIADLKLPPGF
jgi:tricorn protease-like protein